MSAKKLIVLFAVIIGISWAQSEVTTLMPDLDGSTVPSTLSALLTDVTLSPELQSNLPPELQNGQLGGVQDKLISNTRRRCEKYGGPDAFKKFSSAGNEFGQCISKLVNSTLLQKQIEIAKTNGSVDDVFKKYCEQTPDFELCVKTGIETMKVCLSPEEQKQVQTVELVARELAKFICFKEGDRIALFIADGGPECIEKNQEDLKRCANETLAVSDNISDDIIDRGFMSFDERHCAQLTSFQACAVRALAACERPTTANIVDSLFKFAKQSTPCKNYTVAQKPNAATGLFVTTATVTIAAIATLLI